MYDLIPYIWGAAATLLLTALYLLGGPWGIVAKIVSIPRVSNWLINRAMKTPDSFITKDGDVYMERYWLFNKHHRLDNIEVKSYRWLPFSIKIHWIRRPDSDEHMHDHPWNARTFIMRGGYTEERLIYKIYDDKGRVIHNGEKVTFMLPGMTAKIGYGKYHRISYVQPGGAWTLFISGRYKGTWGFLVDGVKIKWKTYLGLK